MVVPMVVLVALMSVSCGKHIIALLMLQVLVVSPSLTCTVGAVIQTNKGPVISVFNQYAYYGEGQTVHSVNQFKHFGIIVDDTPRQFAHGKQRLETPEGYFIPISIRNGLPYIDMHPPTDEELEAYPQVNFTSDKPWELQVFDNLAEGEYHPTLNEYGISAGMTIDHDDPELCTMCTAVAKVCGNKLSLLCPPQMWLDLTLILLN
jgi:hypothetical protein